MADVYEDIQTIQVNTIEEDLELALNRNTSSRQASQANMN